MELSASTIIFQILNFLIIVWILKRYLFEPIAKAMDRREEAIRAKLRQAEEAMRRAEKESSRLAAREAELKRETELIIAEARRRSDEEYAALLKTMSADIAEKRRALLRQIEDEKSGLAAHVRKAAGHVLVSAVKDALMDLSNEKIQDAVVAKFVRLLPKESPRLKKLHAGEPITIASPFALDRAGRQAVKGVLSKALGRKTLKLKYKIDKEIPCGIEAGCESFSVSYGLGGFIEKLSEDLEAGK